MQPLYPDGPTEREVDEMINDADSTIRKLATNGPSSVYLALKDGYTTRPTGISTQTTERLILLALLADRMELIPKILSIFPEASDPLRLTELLVPYSNSDLDSYAKTYASPESRGIPKSGILTAIAALGKLRIMHNLVLQDAVRARFGLVTIVADPFAFSPASLSEITALILKIDTTTTANRDLFIPLQEPITMLKRNYEEVKKIVQRGAVITQDAIRRLRLLLGVIDASDKLFDKMTSGNGATATPGSRKEILDKLLTPTA